MAADSPLKGTIVVFEKGSRWTPELQRQFLETEVQVRGCRAIADLADRLSERGANVVVLELTASPAGCLQWLGRQLGRPGELPAIVIGTPTEMPLEWPVREVGALEFAVDSIGGEALARLCRRQLLLQPKDTV